MAAYGYARVSTREQNEARQMDALEGFGIPPERIYMDKQSGKDFHRPQYMRLARRLKAGDLLVVKSIDRLGRDYAEIQEQWRSMTKERGVDILILDMPLLDTRTRGRDLTGTFIADLVLQILSYVAQTERESIRRRQAEGIAAAKARGVHFGNAPIPTPDDFAHTVARWRRGEITQKEASQRAGMGRSCFYMRVRELRL